jgi:hypothetical protein
LSAISSGVNATPQAPVSLTVDGVRRVRQT